MRLSPVRLTVAVLAVAVGLLALLRLDAAGAGLVSREARVGETPVTILSRAGTGTAPVVVVAHGFSGSRPLMQPFATTLARNGFVVVSYDSLGHGRNPAPLTGNILSADGATQRLVAELGRVADFAHALPESDGRLGLLGHSMATDIIVRHALEDPRVAATVAVSMRSPVVTAEAPANLLVIVGDWEPGLKREALRVLRLAAGPDAEEGETYTDLGAAGMRRVVFAPAVEHIGVLYSATATAEAAAWMTDVFDLPGTGYADARGGWVLVLILASVALAWPLAGLLPRLATPPAGAGLRGWRLWALAGVPAVLTPLLLAPWEVRVLPVLVGDYLAMHFALYGLLTAFGLWRFGGEAARRGLRETPWRPVLAAAVAVAAWGVFVIGGVVDAQVSSFRPTLPRATLMLVLLPGTLLYFLADEWLVRGATERGGAYALTKVFFLLSLAFAMALNLPRLFFLGLLAPALVLFFIVFGLISGWCFHRTGHPAVGALANAVIFALAIAVTFPMVAG